MTDRQEARSAASSHADTIRAVLSRDPEAPEGWPALAALNALVAENERLRRERDDFEQRLHAYKSGEIT